MPLPFYFITALKAVDIQTTERITKFRLSCKLFVYLCVWSNKITISKYCQMTLIKNVKFFGNSTNISWQWMENPSMFAWNMYRKFEKPIFFVEYHRAQITFFFYNSWHETNYVLLKWFKKFLHKSLFGLILINVNLKTKSLF